jgi:hypothetical protein
MPVGRDEETEIKSEKNDEAAKYFNCTARERAAFEAGIKLGGIFHQFTGTPITNHNVSFLENAIKKSVSVQPFVTDVEVEIDRRHLKNKEHQYDYSTLTGDMIKANLKIRYKDVTVHAKMEFIAELEYPLMFISKIE